MDAEKGKSRSKITTAIVLTSVLIALYIASAGPINMLVDKEVISENVLLVYLPLGQLAHHSQSFSRMLNWYLNLWYTA